MISQKKRKSIYLDHASTTPVDAGVIKAMLPYFDINYGNPSSICSVGQQAKASLEKARRAVADILNCESKEIIFTGGGTESINLAIKGLIEANKTKGRHVISSNIEHSAVLKVLDYLKANGHEVELLNADKDGVINPLELGKKIRPDTVLVSLMYANNEIGSVQNIEEFAKICQERQVPLHTDACQAAGDLEIDVKNLGVDLMTLNGSKIYGPKGVGILFKKKSVKIKPLIHGGGQEQGLRAGTENVAFAVAFAEALALSEKLRPAESKRQKELRDFFIDQISTEISDTFLNGSRDQRLSNNVNIRFKGVDGEIVLIRLNEMGICASSGSACASGSIEPSHVLSAIGLSYEEAHSSVRFTLGRSTTKADVVFTVKALKEIVADLRNYIPTF